jgi:hypothetical protein
MVSPRKHPSPTDEPFRDRRVREGLVALEGRDQELLDERQIPGSYASSTPQCLLPISLKRPRTPPDGRA